ncbi:piggyBac transposable element-derived protein 4-like [Cataglyphis hispanica]|uniref:piggyBac transposable element-derived protein 4-like n=1 Tax=Cataglyphis hispanica TaxID=1086592 RepID=UPI0021806B99|nr:piggyBac transposable element-derived protein 4-like [Cataglyphis hispanica]
MESKSEVNDIISTNGKRKHDGSDSHSDSDFDEIIFPLRNRRRILSDDEKEYINEDCEIDLIPNEWVWKDTENITKIWKYSRTSKINIPFGQSVTVLQMINEILTEDFWQIIVTETNRYASQILRNKTHKLKKYEDNWRDTNLDEIKAYFALCILMSQVKKNSLQSYWSKRSIIETPIFRKIMPFWRFSQLSRFLHFSNNDVEDHNNDRLWKLRSIIDYFNEKFKTIYTPEEDLSLDESLMKYTGRMAYKQYNPSKRARFGVKFYKLCKSKSGYCIQFKIYTGQDINKNADTSASESVTMFMCTTISGYGHTLFLDN